MQKMTREAMFNILRGIVMACALPNPQKRALCLFITELEEREGKQNEQR
jgi:hypothetical protein